jgi:NAD(P)-dependent dehydrogenase (short-subunit alcohol dehydrogenase family)/acyl carrier protein
MKNPSNEISTRDFLNEPLLAEGDATVHQLISLHEPNPLIPAFSPSGGEGARRAVEGDLPRFIAPMRDSGIVEAPEPTPSPLPGGEPEIGTSNEAPLLGGVGVGFGEAKRDRSAGQSLEEAKICGDLLRLVQALAAQGATPATALCVVTRGAQPAEGSRSSLPGLAQSPLWGMGKIIDLEYPEFNCLRLDLDPEPRDDEVQSLLLELNQARLDPEIAYRNGRRLAARLTKAPSLREPEKRTFQFRAERSYLITGGLGGLGLQVAGWMLERGARYLILISRSGASTEAKEKLAAMERKGASIRVVKADVAQEEAMSRIFAGMAKDFPPLGGVIHSAGVLDDGALRQQNQERFAKVMAAKASGAWILHRLTEAMDLDFFVLFSSAASLVGSTGQANHGAANAFLDALAHFRRNRGLPASSINWGAWSEIGAAAGPELQEKMRGKGIHCIDPRQGLRALEQVLWKNPIQAGVIAIDWPQFKQQNPSPFFADFASVSGPKEEVVDFARQLRNAEASERRSLLLALVREELSKVLGLSAAMPVDPSQGFFAMGLDSLTSVEFRNRLQNVLRCPLPTTVAFDYPTLDKLAEFLDRTLPAPADRASTTSSSDDSQADQRAALQRLDDDEIAHLLAEAVGSTK